MAKPEQVQAREMRFSRDQFEERELIKTVTLTDHRQIEIRMPLLIDIYEHMGKTELFLEVVSAAANLTMAEVKRLNYLDGLAIMGPLGDFGTAMQSYNAKKSN